MAAPTGRSYAERAWKDNVPNGAIYLCGRNWGLSNDAAEELAAEASNEAHRRLLDKEFATYEGYCAYVTRTAYNCAVDELRRRNRQTPLTDSSLVAEAAGESRAEKIDRLHRALARLSEEDRWLICTKYYEGLTYYELARRWRPDATGSPGAQGQAARNALLLALRRLRRYLEDHAT
jgi:DNA-directed RNA polymerase specialized sigma24 family protein